jgi:hypothetical protein
MSPFDSRNLREPEADELYRSMQPQKTTREIQASIGMPYYGTCGEASSYVARHSKK